MKKCIIVNATSLDQSGALSILKQFINNIPDNSNQWIIFSPPKVKLHSKYKNVRLVPVGVKSLIKRFWWDALGLKKWLKEREIIPSAAISLQNTGFNIGKTVPTFIYYHQSIPFFPYSWNPLKRKERTFWFYKHIYPFFVKLFLRKDTQVFVQLNFIKKGFSEYFSHPQDKVKIFSPSVIKGDQWERKSYKSNDSNTRFLYPAMPHFYKNHRVIYEALKNIDSTKNVEILFTIDPDNDLYNEERIRLIGLQSHESINTLYEECDALLFPSYIETYGLPLLEAALTGMPIIAADLPYAREVLEGYEGAVFVKYDDPKAWAEEIQKIEKRRRFKPIDISNRPSWKEMFEEIIKEIQ